MSRIKYLKIPILEDDFNELKKNRWYDLSGSIKITNDDKIIANQIELVVSLDCHVDDAVKYTIPYKVGAMTVDYPTIRRKDQ